jgi:hypothetical protein
MVFALHLDYLIVTRKFRPLIGTTPSGQLYHDTKPSSIYRDFAKTHANPDTDGNSLNRRAVISNGQQIMTLDRFVNTIGTKPFTGINLDN